MNFKTFTVAIIIAANFAFAASAVASDRIIVNTPHNASLHYAGVIESVTEIAPGMYSVAFIATSSTPTVYPEAVYPPAIGAFSYEVNLSQSQGHPLGNCTGNVPIFTSSEFVLTLTCDVLSSSSRNAK